MACLISSFSFSMHLCASQNLDKEFLPWRSALGRFSRSAASKTAIKLLAPDCSYRGESSVDRSCNHRIMKHCRHFYGSVSLHSNVSFSTQTVISGFWVGPDIEDGWGFVEAFVNQIV
ncbi:hypothetical protein ACSBR2_005381 [Camellia fascicularis]